MTGTVSFGKETKGKIRLQITDPDGKVWEELVPKEKNILVHEGQVVNKGESVVDGRRSAGHPAPAGHPKNWRATSSTKCRTSTVCRA